MDEETRKAFNAVEARIDAATQRLISMMNTQHERLIDRLGMLARDFQISSQRGEMGRPRN